MSLAIGIRDYLIDDAGVYALVADRIYQQQADEQAAEPFIVISFQDSDAPRRLDGLRMGQKSQFEIRVCGLTWESVDALKEAVKAAIGGATGTSVATTLDGENVVMFWSESPESKTHVASNDVIRNQAALNLTILQKSS